MWRGCVALRRAVLTLAAATGAAGTPATAGDRPAPRKWAVEYVLGTEPGLRQEKNLTLRLRPEALVGLSLTGAEKIAIPVRGIVVVSRDTRPSRPVGLFEPATDPSKVETALTAAALAPGAAVGLALAASGASAGDVALLTLLSPDAFFYMVSDIVSLSRLVAEANDVFVYVLWRDRGSVEDALFRIDRGKARSLLASLQEATGRPWVDIPAERDGFLRRLPGEADESFLLVLDRAAWAGHRLVAPGRYRLMAVESPDGPARVFLFKGGRIARSSLKAAFEARSAPRTDPPGAVPAALYDTREGVTFLTEVSGDDTTFRLPPAPLPWEPWRISQGGAPALVFQGGEGWLSIVVRVDQDGEPVLRVPAMHLCFHKPCAGFLIIAAGSIAFDPIYDPHGAHAFSIPRAELEGVKLGKAMGTDRLVVKVAGDEYAFRPLYTGGSTNRPAIGGKGLRTDREILELVLRAIGDFESVVEFVDKAP